jgi:hypothetical protein
MKASTAHLCFALVETNKGWGLYFMGGTYILFFIQMEKTLHSPSYGSFMLFRGNTFDVTLCTPLMGPKNPFIKK